MATKVERYEGIDGLKAYSIIGIFYYRHCSDACPCKWRIWDRRICV